jgi:hypothetical protein
MAQRTYNVYKHGEKVGTVTAATQAEAARKAMAQYGVNTRIFHESKKKNPPKGKWIPTHAVRFNKDGSVSYMR